MNRRALLGSLAAAAAAGTGYHFWPEDGLRNPCLDARLPEELAGNDVISAAWDGIDTAKVWDCHAHLLGTGTSGGGAWVNPGMQSPWNPIRFARLKFFLNAACAEEAARVDELYVDRLIASHSGLTPDARVMLLAFDHAYDEAGNTLTGPSQLYVPNDYARDTARGHPEVFEWIASIHPYRADAVPALEAAVADGARAVKWLPPAMAMDPASPRCDAFYEALARLNVPLLSHAGTERAVHVGDTQELANPLRLRRALDHGVRVIVAHCASLGEGVDTDRGANGPKVSNFSLFARLMEEPRYEKLLYGDISAMTQRNRVGAPLKAVLERDDWHPRLVNGSDYPLPGVFPLFSIGAMAKLGYLSKADARVIRAIRPYNPLLFDFVLKRTLKHAGKAFSASVFETRELFTRAAVA
jgi:mannonate dehydratase